MEISKEIVSFEDALRNAQQNTKEKNCNGPIRILLGNGFTRAYYDDFSYTTLFEAIQNEKDNERIKQLFKHFGTSNFETVLRYLKDAQFVFDVYGVDKATIVSDYERVRDALAQAIVKVHPEKTNTIPEKNKKACFAFLNNFHDVYTVNYDLLLYWVLLQEDDPKFGDYFYRDDDTPSDYCEYFEDGSLTPRHVFFLHGALHLFVKRKVTIKKVWGNIAPLIHQIKAEMEGNYYPLVVAEGESDAKLEQIKGNPYLHHVYSKFLKIEGQLFTFGFSFSEQDDHVIRAIVRNTALRHLWIGIRGDFRRKENKRFLQLANTMAMQRNQIVGDVNKKTKGPLMIHFYNAGEEDIWGKN